MISPRRYKSLLSQALGDLRETRRTSERTLALQRRSRAAQSRLAKRQRDTDLELKEVRTQLELVRREIARQDSLTRQELQATRNLLAMQHEIVATNEAAFGPYRNAFTGRDLVVVASGPSLVHYEPLPGAVHIGVNSLITQSRIPLDVYFAHDFGEGGRSAGVAAQFDERRVPEDCQLFFGVKAAVNRGTIEASQSLTARVGATRYFVSPSPAPMIHQDIRFYPLADFYTIVFAALHFALFTNPRRIYLVGCDVSYFGHFDGSPQPESDEEIRSYLSHRLVGYRRMREFARTFYPETEIVSLNPVNLGGLFEDEFTPGADYRRSEHLAALAAADFSDAAISTFVEAHLVEVKDRHQG